MNGHRPVMLTEVLEAIAPRDGARYVDGTFGGGGYARAILEAADCRCWASTAIPTRSRAARTRGPLRRPAHAGAGRFLRHVRAAGAVRRQDTDGVVLDLGVSSFQFDQPERGFSFREDGPLDMRMSKSGESAADLVNTADEQTLHEHHPALRRGAACPPHRPRHHRRAPGHRHRATRRDRVAKAQGPAAARQPIHPATRTFQALRIQ